MLDCKKFLSHLRILNYIKWIENYRQRVHSDVIRDVEEDLLEHVKILSVSIKSINLELNNYQNIDEVCNILNRIKAIEPLSETIKSIVSKINEIDGWFIQVIRRILENFKKTFSAQSADATYVNNQYLDAKKAECAFQYLKKCCGFPLLQSKTKCLAIKRDLENYTKNM